MKPKLSSQPYSRVKAYYRLIIDTLYWGVLGALVGISLLFSWTLTDGFMSVDLRNRVVGTRVALHQLNPYTYYWHKSDAQTWLDPTAWPDNPVSRLTISPALMLMHIPLAKMDYRQVVRLWFVIQWLLYLGMIYAVAAQTRSSVKKKTLYMLGALFAISAFWLNHVIVGQIYIIFAVLIVWAGVSYVRKQQSTVGALVGILVAFKPTFLLLLLLFGKQKKYWRSFLVFLVAFVSLSTFIFGDNIWFEYGQSLSQYSRLERSKLYSYTNPQLINHLIDGVRNVEPSGTIIVSNTGVKFYLASLGLRVPSSILALIYLILVIGLGWKFKLHKGALNQPASYFISIYLLVWLSDFWSPVPRFAYYEILTLALILLLTLQEKNKVMVAYMLILVASYFFWQYQAWLSNMLLVTTTLGCLINYLERYRVTESTAS